MKLLLEPIEVATDSDGLPRRVAWRGRAWPVAEVQDRWTWRGRWWRDAALAGESRQYFRVVSRGSTMEIYLSDGAWVLSRLWD